MIIYLTIGLLVEILRIVERYLRKLWTFEDFKNPTYVLVELGNFILTPIIWPITIILEIIEYRIRKE